MTSRGGVLAACIVIGGAIVACAGGGDGAPAGTRAGDRIAGASSAFGGGQVSTFALSDGAGGVTHVGATMPLSVLVAVEPTAATASMPDVAKRTTFFDHVYFERFPQGHPPAAYEVDHLDFHFMGISVDEQSSIDCKSEVVPASDLIPGGYVITGESCEPSVGLSAFDSTSPELALKAPQAFTRTMVIGYHDGKVAFLEPMVARTTLEARESFTLAVPRPSHLDRKTLWPKRFDASYDPTTDSYALVFSDFVPMSDVAPIE